MLEFLGNAVIAFVERELVKHEPEIEAMIIEQLGKFSETLLTYVNSKVAEATSSIPKLDGKSKK